ncbi:MAG: type II secretion system F family protein [Candidatus Hydrogenedentes bacterium]|nr:type II secretion system F family protein [Candidatus Hydrogenedentota bacterium]
MAGGNGVAGLPTFWYKGLAEGAIEVKGTVAAASRQEALQQILSRGQHPLDLREQAPSETRRTPGFQWRRRLIRLAPFTRQLATLSASGVPMVKGLNVLIEQAQEQRAKDLLTAVCESVQSGSTLADAMERYPETFPPIMTSMVRVGEQGGALDAVLEELSDLFEKEESLKGEVRAAVAYPALVLAAGVVSAIVLIVFFIPRLKIIFEDVGQSLPWPTRILLGLSDFVAAYGWFLAAAVVAAALGVRWVLRNPEARLVLDQLSLRIPWVGTFISTLSVARLTRLMGTLTRGGVSIVEALTIVEPVLGNRAVAKAVSDISSRIRSGESLASLMRQSPIFPPLSVQMVAVGEESGQLDHMLLRVADAFDRETTAATKVMTSMLAPALILVVASVVGFIIIAMLLPIFQLSTVLK